MTSTALLTTSWMAERLHGEHCDLAGALQKELDRVMASLPGDAFDERAANEAYTYGFIVVAGVRPRAGLSTEQVHAQSAHMCGTVQEVLEHFLVLGAVAAAREHDRDLARQIDPAYYDGVLGAIRSAGILNRVSA